MNDRKFTGKRKKPPLIASLFLFAIIGTGIIIWNQYENSIFSEGTKISGVDCSGLNVEQSIEKIENAKVTLQFSGGISYTVRGKELGRSIVGKAEIEDFLSEQKSKEGKETKEFELSPEAYKVSSDITKEYLDTLIELDPARMKESQDAYLERDEDGLLRIVPEVYGNEIIPYIEGDVSVTATTYSTVELQAGKNVIDFREITKKPTIIRYDPELVSTMNKINRTALTKVEYELAEGNSYSLDFDVIKDWIYQDENGKYRIDLEERVDEVVGDLREEVWNIGAYRTVTTKTGTYTLRVAYGYRDKLDPEAEKQKLLEELEKGGEYFRRPEYLWFNDFEGLDTYIEGVISEQRVTMDVAGEEILDVPFVSGTKGINDSPTGIFYSNFKARDYPIKMFGEHIVDPWITVDGNVGFHGANEWRSSSEYTPDRYEWDGSNGCFNLIDADGLIMFENIVINETPIIIHD